ncbi:MAG: hypothetical protein WDZ41_01940 [Candidatus Babeliales bacterium]
MKAVVFSSPGREQMLENLINELNGIDVFTIDSKETFGKEKFWMRWEIARQYLLSTNEDNYLILPDDVHNLNLDVIKKVSERFTDAPFACSIIYDGRNSCWGAQKRLNNTFKIDDINFTDFGFFDCGGLTNRRTLEQIVVKKPHEGYFDRPNKSSGVGMQLTSQMRRKRIPMYLPSKSLCYHGNHESVMHPIERKIHPLISK